MKLEVDGVSNVLWGSNHQLKSEISVTKGNEFESHSSLISRGILDMKRVYVVSSILTQSVLVWGTW